MFKTLISQNKLKKKTMRINVKTSLKDNEEEIKEKEKTNQTLSREGEKGECESPRP